MCTNTHFLLVCKQCVKTIAFYIFVLPLQKTVMPLEMAARSAAPPRRVCQPPGTISIKVEEDIGGEDGAASESLRVDAAGSSHMSSHGEELKILSVYGKGEGPLAVGGHDTLFTASEVEALSWLSADHSVAKSLDCGERLIKRQELTGHRGGRKSRPHVLRRKILPNNAKMIDNMHHHTDEKPMQHYSTVNKSEDS
ncbi:unnamed protein product [Boreogadus saida]